MPGNPKKDKIKSSAAAATAAADAAEEDLSKTSDDDNNSLMHGSGSGSEGEGSGEDDGFNPEDMLEVTQGFWECKIPSGKPVTVRAPFGALLRISNAALELAAFTKGSASGKPVSASLTVQSYSSFITVGKEMPEDVSSTPICHLSQANPHHSVDLTFGGGVDVTFQVHGTHAIHLSGAIVVSGEDGDSDEDGSGDDTYGYPPLASVRLPDDHRHPAFDDDSGDDGEGEGEDGSGEGEDFIPSDGAEGDDSDDQHPDATFIDSGDEATIATGLVRGDELVTPAAAELERKSKRHNKNGKAAPASKDDGKPAFEPKVTSKKQPQSKGTTGAAAAAASASASAVSPNAPKRLDKLVADSQSIVSELGGAEATPAPAASTKSNKQQSKKHASTTADAKDTKSADAAAAAAAAAGSNKKRKAENVKSAAPVAAASAGGNGKQQQSNKHKKSKPNNGTAPPTAKSNKK